MHFTLHPKIRYEESFLTLSDDDLDLAVHSTMSLLQELGAQQDRRKLCLGAGAWLGCEYLLGVYGLQGAGVMRRDRGMKIGHFYKDLFALADSWPSEYRKPVWSNDVDICRSHRAYLIRTRRATSQHYKRQWPNTPNMPVLYPQIIRDGGYRLRLSEEDEQDLLRGRLELPAWLEYDRNKREVIRND